MESTIVYWGNIRVILGLYADNGKENGNCYSFIGSIIPPSVPEPIPCSQFWDTWRKLLEVVPSPGTEGSTTNIEP